MTIKLWKVFQLFSHFLYLLYHLYDRLFELWVKLILFFLFLICSALFITRNVKSKWAGLIWTHCLNMYLIGSGMRSV